jgi:hypothetical protein
MKAIQDIRYKADGAKTATAETVVLPMRLCLERTTHHAATREARSLVEQLQTELPQFAAKGGTLQMGDLERPQIQKTSELILEQESRDEVRLQLEFFLVLTLQQGQFWDRAELIAHAIDFVQRFCAKPREKHTTIQMQTARFLDESPKTQIPVGTPAA